jgi:hypothetical protein
MQLPQVHTVPSGLGFELSPEEDAIREMIRASWSEDETATRKQGIPVESMIRTFHETSARLLDKKKARDRAAAARKLTND